ncbi:RNA methyltransferase [Opitutaceae bacterium]
MSTRPSQLTICGLAAVKARFESAPDSIVRLFFDEATSRKIAPMCKALAAARKVYRCVPPIELEKVSGTIHHGGIVAVVTAPALVSPTQADVVRWAKARPPVLLLDRIGNAHNLGALARTAAFLGVEHIVIPAHPSAAVPSEAAYRVAEGGLEQVKVWRANDLAALAKALVAAGYEVFGAATRGGRVDALVPGSKPVALIMGNEEHGLDPKVAAACTRLVTIPGTGKVESLNVSVAGAILLYALLRDRR